MADRAVGVGVSALADTASLQGHQAAGDHIVVDLRDARPNGRPILGPWLSDDANLLTAGSPILAVRRGMDIAGAFIGLLVLLPLFVAVAAAIKLTSRGPILYKHSRVGKDGVEFDFYKFRSMRLGAEGEQGLLAGSNETTGPIFKMRHDPRQTRVGHWIRRASLDELPQLCHVLTGHMSLIGPRPPLPDEVAKYTDWEWQRLTVKPGITCIWQVSGRSDLDFDTWVTMDIHYIEHWTPWLDLELLIRTIPAVLSGKGAY